MSKTKKPKSSTPKHLSHRAKKTSHKAVRPAKQWTGKTFNWPRIYVWGAFVVLLVTTAYWSLLGAHYHLQNADQLVNSMLSANMNGLQDALLPNAHSFLLKWPLFFVSGLLGPSKGGLVLMTVLVVLATVVSLAYLLYRIEKRPYILGTIYLMIASMLLLVPIAPYPGALLPVNMAMLATRNVEYIVYILALYFVHRGRHFWHWVPAKTIEHVRHTSRMALAGVGLLALLFATDKLFVTLSIGGSIGFIALYTLAKQRPVVKVGIAWLCSSLVAFVLALGMLLLFSALKITHIVSGGSGLAPYNLIHSMHDFVLGSIYAVFAVLTTFGANPVGDTRLLHDIPSHFTETMFSWAGVAILINIAIFGLFLYLTIRCVISMLRTKVTHDKAIRFWPVLAGMLVVSSIVSIAAFVFSQHYYPVDARYVAICFFAVVVAATVDIGMYKPKQKHVLIAGAVATIAIVLSLVSITVNHNKEMAPLEPYAQNNRAIARSLKHHKVQYLVGDYWRVVPIAFQYGTPPIPVPLGTCTGYSAALTSTKWQPNLHQKKFAVLVSTEKGLTGFPACTVEEVTKAFGEPSSKEIVVGTLETPKEVLLYYKPYKPVKPQAAPPKCTDTIMNVVAHEDDDLLFINPDTANAIVAGTCMRTVYLTAGDAGQGWQYWEGRERGSMAAYSYMAHIPQGYWAEQSIKLTDTAYATVATLQSKITLVFLRLPDGGLYGQGFEGTAYKNLERLNLGETNSITSVDRRSVYTSDQLQSVLYELMNTYKPSTVRTQNTSDGTTVADHPDHKTVGLITDTVFARYAAEAAAQGRSVALQHYIGYQVREQPQNVFDPELAAKMAAFAEYATRDGAVCHTVQECTTDGTYSEYLTRQYWW